MSKSVILKDYATGGFISHEDFKKAYEKQYKVDLESNSLLGGLVEPYIKVMDVLEELKEDLPESPVEIVVDLDVDLDVDLLKISEIIKRLFKPA